MARFNKKQKRVATVGNWIGLFTTVSFLTGLATSHAAWGHRVTHWAAGMTILGLFAFLVTLALFVWYGD